MDVMYAAGAGCAGAAIHMDVMADNCSCVICTSTIRGGRMLRAHDSMDGGDRVMPGAIAEDAQEQRFTWM
jgi:hypothetical protein